MTIEGGLQVRKARLRYFLNQEDVAKRIGIAARELSKIERGLVQPARKLVLQIAEYLDVDEDSLSDAFGYPHWAYKQSTVSDPITPAHIWARKLSDLYAGDALIVNCNQSDFRICRCTTKAYLPVYVVRVNGNEFFKSFILDEHESRFELAAWLADRGVPLDAVVYQRDDPVALALSGIPPADQIELPMQLVPLEDVPNKRRAAKARAVIQSTEFRQLSFLEAS